MLDVIMDLIVAFLLGFYLVHEWRSRDGWKGMCWLARGAWVATLVGSAGMVTGFSPMVFPSFALSVGGVVALSLHGSDDDDNDDDGERKEIRIRIAVPKLKTWGVPARRPLPA
jgi:hypothetical protein